MKHLLFLILLLSCLNAGAQVQLYQYKGYVMRLDNGPVVQDGDTFHCLASVGFDTYRQIIIRLAGLNAPEMKGADSLKAQRSKNYLSNRILGKTIFFNSKAYDIYHRSIAVVYLSDTAKYSLNQELIDKGYAKYQRY